MKAQGETPELSREQKLELYYWMQLTRTVEDRLLLLYRQGRIVGGLYRGRGQEAISVGTTYALEPRDKVAHLIRNLGTLLMRGYRPVDIFRQYMGRADSPTGGRDGNVHFGDVAGKGVVAPISMLGAMIPVMTGVAWAGRQLGQGLVALTYIGDGGTSTGDFHEGMNLAAVWKVPLVVVGEHNHYAYSTPVERQMAVRDLAERARAYGIPTCIVDGNDVLAVYAAAKAAVDHARSGRGPFFLEVKTMRMQGHAEHDDASYVPRELLEEWAARDPIERYRRVLLEEGVSEAELREAEERIRAEVERDLSLAEASPLPDPAFTYGGVYAE